MDSENRGLAWKKSLVSSEDSIRRALESISDGNIQLAIIVDESNRLLGVATDGDIRRGFLNGKGPDDLVREVMNRNPVTISESQGKEEAINLMRKHHLHQIPVLDKEHRVVNVILLDDLIRPGEKPNPVVLMAGGLGTRLRPLTDNCPKPMLKVGGRPILETAINHFKSFGFSKFYISVNYLSDQIMDYFGDGSRFDCSISYLREEDKLGTAGSLSLIDEEIDMPFFVMNGDLLTNINVDQFLEFHRHQDVDATMGVRDYDFQVPYGVVNVKGHLFEGVDEKPVQRYFINAGIYLLDPSILKMLKPDSHMNMTDLFERIREEGRRSAVFPIREYWLDIGLPEDFERANGDYNQYFKTV